MNQARPWPRSGRGDKAATADDQSTPLIKSSPWWGNYIKADERPESLSLQWLIYQGKGHDYPPDDNCLKCQKGAVWIVHVHNGLSTKTVDKYVEALLISNMTATCY